MCYIFLAMTDLEFIQSCIEGNGQVWDDFIDKYSSLIYNYIYQVLKIKGYALAQEYVDDVFQEVFLSLCKDDFKKLRSFGAKNGCSLASWLRQVSVNCAIDYLRKIRPSTSLDEEIDEGDGISLKGLIRDYALSLPEKLATEEKFSYLKNCIERLRQDDKYFLELHIYRGLSLEKLKKHFRLSRGALDMYKGRIVTKLRQCFKARGFLS